MCIYASEVFFTYNIDKDKKSHVHLLVFAEVYCIFYYHFSNSIYRDAFCKQTTEHKMKSELRNMLETPNCICAS